jgi:flavin reductase (DIM6/NTAB) family NADH-FMN oxidoreductase RutF
VSNAYDLIDPEELSRREKYRLMTSLVVPRPIAWVSTRSMDGVPNLAPFSYFAALSSDPMLVGISIGFRRGEPKDSLVNIREAGDFCLNMVTERHFEAMNLSSGEYPPEVDEFEVAGLQLAQATAVDAPYVADCPAVFECRLLKEVDLDGAGSALVIGRVISVRLSEGARPLMEEGFIDVRPWVPMGRLWGDLYAPVTETRALARP